MCRNIIFTVSLYLSSSLSFSLTLTFSHSLTLCSAVVKLAVTATPLPLLLLLLLLLLLPIRADALKLNVHSRVFKSHSAPCGTCAATDHVRTELRNGGGCRGNNERNESYCCVRRNIGHGTYQHHRQQIRQSSSRLNIIFFTAVHSF